MEKGKVMDLLEEMQRLAEACIDDVNVDSFTREMVSTQLRIILYCQVRIIECDTKDDMYLFLNRVIDDFMKSMLTSKHESMTNNKRIEMQHSLFVYLSVKNKLDQL